MFFNEGGWPEGVDCTDPEQTARFRKRTEKEEVLSSLGLLISEPNGALGSGVGGQSRGLLSLCVSFPG